MTTQSQGHRLIRILRLRPFGMTYGELQRTGISTCPQKRLQESAHYLKPNEKLGRRIGPDGLVRIRIERLTKAQ